MPPIIDNPLRQLRRNYGMVRSGVSGAVSGYSGLRRRAMDAQGRAIENARYKRPAPGVNAPVAAPVAPPVVQAQAPAPVQQDVPPVSAAAFDAQNFPNRPPMMIRAPSAPSGISRAQFAAGQQPGMGYQAQTPQVDALFAGVNAATSAPQPEGVNMPSSTDIAQRWARGGMLTPTYKDASNPAPSAAVAQENLRTLGQEIVSGGELRRGGYAYGSRPMPVAGVQAPEQDANGIPAAELAREQEARLQQRAGIVGNAITNSGTIRAQDTLSPDQKAMLRRGNMASQLRYGGNTGQAAAMRLDEQKRAEMLPILQAQAEAKKGGVIAGPDGQPIAAFGPETGEGERGFGMVKPPESAELPKGTLTQDQFADNMTVLQKELDDELVAAQAEKREPNALILRSVRQRMEQLQGMLAGRTPPVAAKPGQPATAQSGAPKVGEVRKGYKFKGGDPSDKANWERV